MFFFYLVEEKFAAHGRSNLLFTETDCFSIELVQLLNLQRNNSYIETLETPHNFREAVLRKTVHFTLFHYYSQFECEI